VTAAQLDTLTRPASDERRRNRFVQARFEALAEWGIPTADALAIADATDVDILDAVELLRHGCPSDLVLGILG
jgi:hypothetical protein